LRENALHFEGVGAVILGDPDDERGLERGEPGAEGEALVGGAQAGEQVPFEEAGLVGMNFLGEDRVALGVKCADDTHIYREGWLKVGW
jgi:hypothetical protein